MVKCHMRELICVGNRAKGVFGAAPPVANVVAVEPFVLGDN
jgi:hypothetical protein